MKWVRVLGAIVLGSVLISCGFSAVHGENSSEANLSIKAPSPVNQQRVFSAPGIYGGEVLEVIPQDVLISSPGVTLRNTVVLGKVIVDCGDRISRTVIQGAVIDSVVCSGSSTTVVELDDCLVRDFHTATHGNFFRMVLRGATRIQHLELCDPAEVESGGLKRVGLVDVSVNTANRILLKAGVSGTLSIIASSADVKLGQDVYVEKLTVSGDSGVVHTSINTKIGTFIAERPVELIGTGQVGRAEINSDPVRLTYPADTTALKSGLKSPIYTGTYVESVTPTETTTVKSMNASFTFKFSKKMRLETGKELDAQNSDWVVALTEGGPNGNRRMVDGTVSHSGDKTSVTIKPIIELKPGTLYCMTVIGVEDYSHGQVLGRNQFFFRTASSNPPTVLSMTPREGSTENPQDSEVVIEFSDLMVAKDNAVLTTESLKKYVEIRRDGPQGAIEPFEAVVEHHEGRTVIRLLTEYLLESGTNYFVSVSGLKSQVGMPLDRSYTAYFSTSSDKTFPIVKQFDFGQASRPEGSGERWRLVFNKLVRAVDKKRLTDTTVDDLITLVLVDDTEYAVPFDARVSYEGGGTVITVEPVPLIPPGAQLKLSVDGLEDFSSNELVGAKAITIKVKD